jgi:hypothetical protein
MIACDHGVTKLKLLLSHATACAVVVLLSLWLQGVRAEPPGSQQGQAAPSENWRTSPWHGAIDGFGQIIPCRCRYRGQEYRLGEVVCMQTHVGTVMTRCDLFINNTSWIPTTDACTISRAPDGLSVAAR